MGLSRKQIAFLFAQGIIGGEGHTSSQAAIAQSATAKDAYRQSLKGRMAFGPVTKAQREEAHDAAYSAHNHAARLHDEAADAHKKSGNEQAAKIHTDAASDHRAHASKHERLAQPS